MAPQWEMLVYMAGDNDLGFAVDADIAEMKKADDNDVRIAIQLDRANHNTQRLQIEKHDAVVKKDLGVNLDFGKPSVLTEALENLHDASASRTMALLWDHGNGWLDFAIQRVAEHGFVVMKSSRKSVRTLRHAFFTTSVEEILLHVEAIGLDTTSNDFLDNKQLHDALRAVVDKKQKKFDIIGCDACYMNMIEIAYEIRDCGDVLIGSEEKEQPGGWPYDTLTKRFKDGADAEAVAKGIVADYGTQAVSARDPFSVLSAIRLSKIDDVASAVDRLGAALLPLVGSSFGMLKRVRKATKTFLLYHYIDLADFAQQAKAAFPSNNSVTTAAQAVIDAVRGAVIATSNNPSAPNANGIAVYLPNDVVNGRYADLTFVQQKTNWSSFVRRYGEARAAEAVQN